MTKRSHHDLRVWQCAIELVDEVYRLTSTFPAEEKFGLTLQMRRAAVSVPSNIAEGAARATQKEYLHFLHVARGSLSELETQVVIAKRQKFITESTVLDLALEDSFNLLAGLIRSKR